MCNPFLLTYQKSTAIGVLWTISTILERDTGRLPNSAINLSALLLCFAIPTRKLRYKAYFSVILKQTKALRFLIVVHYIGMKCQQLRKIVMLALAVKCIRCVQET